ncbi:MAG: rhomboid family intramembrane serine protease [Deltaproteobacteria bacterium]|nr:rhomboid family intramembrane serine protease [Deltaproteobacteria bacterium]
MIILPIGHDSLTVRRLPLATGIIIVACIVVSALTCNRIEEETAPTPAPLAAVATYYAAHDHLALSEPMLKALPQGLRSLYAVNREWMAWYEKSPGDVDLWLKEGVVAGSVAMEQALAEVARQFGGAAPSALAQAGLPAADYLRSDARKRTFLSRLVSLDPGEIERQQAELDRLAEAFGRWKKGEILPRFGFVPGKPRPLALLTYPFLHLSVLHLVFNMLFLWFAAVKLEDIWGRPTFVAAYALFGAAAGLTHAAMHPTSLDPLVGASGAVAGLMGAFLVRLHRTRIDFAYAYWIGRFRYGTFAAPAYFMLPLWFAGELSSGLLFDVGNVAYWSHVGGFAAGVAVALLLRAFRYEERVLKREPDPLPRPETSFVAPLAPTAAGIAEPFRITRLRVQELVPSALSERGLEGLTWDNARVELAAGDVICLAPARIDRVDREPASTYFSRGVPEEPAFAILVVSRAERGPQVDVVPAYMIDLAKVRFAALLPSPRASLRENALLFANTLADLFRGARVVRGDEIASAGRVPVYTGVEEFVEAARKACTAVPGSRMGDPDHPAGT